MTRAIGFTAIGRAVVIGSLLCAASANATLISSAAVIEWSSQRFGPFQQDRQALHLTDGSGLLGSGRYSSTVYEGVNWLGENGSAVTSGPNAERPVTDQWLKFDLGALYGTVDMRVWNLNDLGYTSRGVKDLHILVDANNDSNLSNWTDLGAFVFNQAPGSDSVDFSQIVSLASSNDFRYVYFDIDTNWGDNYPPYGFVGLSEVQFNTAAQVSVDVPEPMSIALLGMGLAGIGFTRRRRA
jgi:hypothetical protein